MSDTTTKVTLPKGRRHQNDRILGHVFTDGIAEIRNLAPSAAEFFKKYIQATVDEPVEVEDKKSEKDVESEESAEEKTEVESTPVESNPDAKAETKEAPDAKKVPATKSASK